jgi:hypothetical protein
MENIFDKFDALLNEETKPNGLKSVEAANKTNKKSNEKIYKETIKQVDASIKNNIKSDSKPVKFDKETDSEYKEYLENVANLSGLESIEYQHEPSEKFKEYAKDSIVGSSKTGNRNQEDTDDDFGTNLLKSIKKSLKKKNDANQDLSNIKYGKYPMYTPDRKVSKMKTAYNESNENVENKPLMNNKTKVFKFPSKIENLSECVNKIKTNHFNNGEVFKMTDGDNTYRMKWDSVMTEGYVVLEHESKSYIVEQTEKIHKLFNYKSSSSKSLSVKTKSKQDEVFKNLYNKTKNVVENANKEGAIVTEQINKFLKEDVKETKFDKFLNEGSKGFNKFELNLMESYKNSDETAKLKLESAFPELFVEQYSKTIKKQEVKEKSQLEKVNEYISEAFNKIKEEKGSDYKPTSKEIEIMLENMKKSNNIISESLNFTDANKKLFERKYYEDYKTYVGNGYMKAPTQEQLNRFWSDAKKDGYRGRIVVNENKEIIYKNG